MQDQIVIEQQTRRRDHRRSLSRLSDSTIIRIISYCDLKTNRHVSLVSRRFGTLSCEQLESAAKISFLNERAELSSMYPESTSSWPNATRRNLFFDHLEIQEQETLAFFDRAHEHLAPFTQSVEMTKMKDAMTTVNVGSERIPSNLLPVGLHRVVYIYGYNAVFKCDGWRKWLSRAIRIVQCLFCGGKQNDAQVSQFLRYSPLLCPLIIRFMTLYTERMHYLANFDDLVNRSALVNNIHTHTLGRDHAQYAFEAWMLQCGQTAVDTEKQCFRSYLLAAAIMADFEAPTSLSHFRLSAHTVNVQASETVGKFGARFPVVRFDRVITKRLLETLHDQDMVQDMVTVYLELERREHLGELRHVFEYMAAESRDRLERPLPIGMGYHYARLDEGFKHIPGREDKHIRSWYRLPGEQGLMPTQAYKLWECKAWFITRGFIPGEKVLLPK